MTLKPDRSWSSEPLQVDWNGVHRTRYRIHQRITYRYEGPVRSLQQRLVIQPRSVHGDQRRISRRLSVLDAIPRRVDASVDVFGNTVVTLSIPRVEKEVTFVTSSIVERDAQHGPHLAPASMLEDAWLLAPTRLTGADRAIDRLAEELHASGLRGGAIASAANECVHNSLTYEHGATSVRTTAAEALARGAGVCQDYAHVLLALTRRLGLPSRYISGQMLGFGGSHAWVEVLVPDGGGHARVLSLDPTHGRATGFQYITVAVGRDYADVAPLSGTYRAPFTGSLTTTKRVFMTALGPDDCRRPSRHRLSPRTPTHSGLVADQLVVRIEDGELAAPEPDHPFDQDSGAQFDPGDAPPPGKDQEKAPSPVPDLATEAGSSLGFLDLQRSDSSPRANAVTPRGLVDRRDWRGGVSELRAV
jgi:transglutaminase-like putative cysteine protease